MLEFLLALLTTATVGALLIPLLRARVTSTSRFEGELAIYRDQLAEIERERTGGALSESEAAAARLEIERRILAADSNSKTAAPSSDALNRLLPPALALAIPLLALGLYLKVGHPGLPAAPFVAGARLSADLTMEVAQLVAQARARVTAEPNNADAQSALGEALTLEADGTVIPAAVEAFNKALARQPDDARSLYYLGLHDVQSGDSAAALKRWQELEARSPPNAPFLPMLRAEMARVAQAAGLPANTTMPQPSREQQEAMATLTPEQRQQAIRGMVEGLA
ncbi:MAG TPA: c-type cytochrome biogenesis protein CcmI, partial [Stellaceae bacterium]|nr:c-type cytochrome biogenesis protein CcmI [Stellaceae bacterium]